LEQISQQIVQIKLATPAKTAKPKECLQALMPCKSSKCLQTGKSMKEKGIC